MRTKLKLLVIFFIIFLTLNNITAQDNSKKTFDINSKTVFKDLQGNIIEFSTFINLRPDVDYTNLNPIFNDEGNLDFVEISLIKKIDTTASVEERIENTTDESKNTHVIEKKEGEPNEKNISFRFTSVEGLKGQYAPYFNEKNLDGEEYSTTTLYNKIVVIKFWFLSCAPCLEEIPELNQLVQKFEDNDDVVFIAPATDENEAVKKFIARRQFDYTILTNAYDIHGDFKVSGYPTHLVIGKDGNVKEVVSGKNVSTFEILEEAILLETLKTSHDVEVSKVEGYFSYSSDLVIKDEFGNILSESQFAQKMNEKEYNIYKRRKYSGDIEYFLYYNAILCILLVILLYIIIITSK